MSLGRQTVELKHVPRWQLASADRPAGVAVRALAWLGPEKADEALSRIKRKLPPDEFGELVAAAPQLPTWLARSVERLRMADLFLTLSKDDWREALAVAADRTGRPIHLLEKDVWVVWTLQTLFSSKLGEHLAFKGGTSLSKAYTVKTIFRGCRPDLRYPRPGAGSDRRQR